MMEVRAENRENMMKYRALLTIAMTISGILGGRGMGQPSHAAHLSRSDAQRLGLKHTWTTHVGSSGNYGRVAGMAQYVSPRLSYVVREISYGKNRKLISEHDPDRYGVPLGRDGSERIAKRTVIKLKEAGWDAQWIDHSVPEVTLYVVTSGAVVHAIDAETGRARWTSTVGHPGYCTHRPAISEQNVAVINGSSLYLLKRETGEVYWNKRLTGVPLTGPAISDSMVFTMMFDGFIEAYYLEVNKLDEKNELDRAPWRFNSTGRGTSPHIVATNSVCWGTDAGYLYVGNSIEGGVRYRFEAKDSFPAHPTFLYPNRLYAATMDGFVYGLDKSTGEAIWRFSCGHEILASPVPISDGVHVLVEPKGMYRLDALTGGQQWWAPRVRRILASSEKRVYCIDDNSQLVVFDSRSGAAMGAVSVRGTDLFHTNWHTDRIILGTTSGRIQCLRERRADRPLIHVSLQIEAPDDKLEMSPTKEDGLAGDEMGDDDVTDDGGDPFGAGIDPDPFGGFGDDAKEGGDENPFDVGEDNGLGGEDVDPFGG